MTNPWQPQAENVPLCETGHPMAAADQRCALCGAARRSAGQAAQGSQPPAGSDQETTGFPGPADYDQPGGFQQPGEFQQPGGYDQPAGFPQPGGFQAPGTYQDPGAGYQHAGGTPPAGYQAPAWGGYQPQPGTGNWGPGGYPMAVRRTSPLAIASLVLGIIWIFWLGSIAALIFGYVSLRQIKSRNESGRGMAIAGIVLGWLGMATLLLSIIIGIALGHAHTASPPP